MATIERGRTVPSQPYARTALTTVPGSLGPIVSTNVRHTLIVGQRDDKYEIILLHWMIPAPDRWQNMECLVTKLFVVN